MPRKWRHVICKFLDSRQSKNRAPIWDILTLREHATLAYFIATTLSNSQLR
jgi:hypothetical protein